MSIHKLLTMTQEEKEKAERNDIRRCYMCRYAEDWHCNDNFGNPFMCRCRFFRWSRFLYSRGDVCKEFSPFPQYVPELKLRKLI